MWLSSENALSWSCFTVIFNNYSSGSIAHEAEGIIVLVKCFSKMQLVGQKKYRDKTSFTS